MLLLLSLKSVQGSLVRSSVCLLSLHDGTKIIGEGLERFRYRRTFQDVLRQCKETTKEFEGSEETLRHILRVKETLERLVAELN